MFSFFFHYNKPRSQQKNKPQISLHFKKTCYVVDNIEVNVKISGRIRKNQPKFVMVGKAKSIEVKEGIAYVT